MKTDMQLKKDVEAELEWEPSIDAAGIGVEVKDGIVTLAGHLDSYLAKLAAERAVQRVAGVRGVAEEIDVRLPGSNQRTDADIARAATDALQWNSFIPQGCIKVKVENGWITLAGEVDWAYERSAAESTVHGLRGVKGVLNQIQLKQKASPNDIRVKIEAALQRAAHLDTKGLKVLVEDGRVTLEGRVHSYVERHIVEDATWAAPGVSAVVDRLTVSP
ncbi:MAG: BON domain-containing protein [Gammaproteobacteria bacterium]|nr:BON domain-containing protein [Gammaproteobacteria bacterium]